MPVELTMNLLLLFNQTKTVDGFLVQTEPNANTSIAQSNGTAINEQDLLWFDKGRVLSAGASEEIDLAGSLSDAFGDTITFARVKGISIQNTNITAGDVLRVGGAASNAFPLFVDTSDKFDIGPGAYFLYQDPSEAGKPVTGGTGDLLKFEEIGGANDLTFDILIWGASA